MPPTRKKSGKKTRTRKQKAVQPIATPATGGIAKPTPVPAAKVQPLNATQKAAPNAIIKPRSPTVQTPIKSRSPTVQTPIQPAPKDIIMPRSPTVQTPIQPAPKDIIMPRSPTAKPQPITTPPPSRIGITSTPKQYVPSTDLIRKLRDRATKFGPFNIFYTDKQLSNVIAQRRTAATQKKVPLGKYIRETTTPLTTIFNKQITVNCSDPRRSCTALQWKKDNDIHKTLGRACAGADSTICTQDQWDAKGASTVFWKHASVGKECFPTCHSGDGISSAGNKWIASLVRISGYTVPTTMKGPLQFPKYNVYPTNTNMINIQKAMNQAWNAETVTAVQLDTLTDQLFDVLQQALLCYCERAHTASQTYNASSPISDTTVATSRNYTHTGPPQTGALAANEGCMACTPGSTKPQHANALRVAQLKYINTAVLWFNWVATPELWPKFFMPFPQDAAIYSQFVKTVVPATSPKCLKSMDRASLSRASYRASSRTPPTMSPPSIQIRPTAHRASPTQTLVKPKAILQPEATTPSPAMHRSPLKPIGKQATRFSPTQQKPTQSGKQPKLGVPTPKATAAVKPTRKNTPGRNTPGRTKRSQKKKQRAPNPNITRRLG
jgi:hypothetical protein